MYTRYNTQKPVTGIQLNRRHLLSKGLVGLWLFNEGSGATVFDLSGFGRNGTLQNNACWKAGEFGSALEFDGNSDFVDTGWYPAAGNYSFVTWIKFNSLPDTVQGDVFVGCNDAAGHRLYFGYYNDGGGRDYYLGAGDGYKTSVPITWSVNTWYQVVYTLDGSTARLYSNTVEVDSLSYSWSGTSTRSLYFGGANWGAGTRWLDGLIDHVLVYNRVLSASEIRLLYQEPFCMFERGLIELWSAATAVSVKDYTRGDVGTMPSNNDDDLETAFTTSEYDDVESDDATRVAQAATGEFAAFLFKDKNTSQEQISVTWNGQSDRAPSDSTIYLQIFNRTTTSWENLDSDSTTGANTDFDLTGIVTSDLGDYFDGNYWISCRVYQQAV